MPTSLQPPSHSNVSQCGRQRRRLRAHVREDETAVRLHRVARDLHLLLEAAVRVDGLLKRLLDALAGLVHHPAVVHAAQAVLLRYAIGEIDATVRAGALDEPQCAGLVLIEHQVLAEDAHRLGRLVVHLRGGGDGVPVPPEQFAHRRTRHHTGKRFILLGSQHGPSCGLKRATYTRNSTHRLPAGQASSVSLSTLHIPTTFFRIPVYEQSKE